jgi:mono/diheme cytochrome c family protein
MNAALNQQPAVRRNAPAVGYQHVRFPIKRAGNFQLPHALALLLVLAGICSACNALAAGDLLERGRYLFNAAGCISCHTGDRPLAGGRPITTPFGTFYSPNITPDPEHGIGTWSEEDFIRALREGVSPRGRHYYPAFPYTTYTRMTREDMTALWTYLNSRPALPQQNRPHELPWPVTSQTLLGLWKRGWFTPGVFAHDPAQSPEWNRGAYLATALGHCTECHTPRGWTGIPLGNRYLAGTRKGPEGVKVPNITPHKATGIGNWSRQEMIDFLNTGRRPDGRYTGNLMVEVLGTSSMPLSDDDKYALATYLGSLSPIHYDVYFTFDPFPAEEYLDQ